MLTDSFNSNGAQADLLTLASDVFATVDEAIKWMDRPHQSLAGATPKSACETQAGAEAVRRILVAVKYGGVV
ncbi:antitoxin Xre/MbcA/ParS toxin-binding domain-containing protein [Roseateles sp.]|jgi:uncharacterized protein (DUF2384 family)|uniref:antitoxin Xre/MbcA/ParS toxin-binding domain-containing protein n=1 Tax=Roseateles sp. TaxID=1971397 RepID=UPI0039196940